jgi:hypothetical protein
MILLRITPRSNLSIQLSTQNSTKWTCPSARLHPNVRTIFSEGISSHATHVCMYLPDDMAVTWRQQHTGSRVYPDFKIFRVHKSNMLLHNVVLYRHLCNWQSSADIQLQEAVTLPQYCDSAAWGIHWDSRLWCKKREGKRTATVTSPDGID